MSQLPLSIAQLIEALDDNADALHLDMTPSVSALSTLGLPAIHALFAPLTSENEITRLHAQRALEAIVQHRHGFRAGQGFPNAASENAMRNEWKSNGDYDYRANVASRNASLAKWRQWLTTAKE